MDSKEKVASLHLDLKFNIEQKTYLEFIDNLIFDEYGNFRGAKVNEINHLLNNEQKKEFWSYFGLTYDDGFPQEANRDLVFTDYKPKFRGCKWDPDWICVIYTDATEVQQQ